jgi:ornithine carbamoyltransferase
MNSLAIPPAAAIGRPVLRSLDLAPQEILAILDLAAALKREPAAFADSLRGRGLVMLFEKPSLRTRVSFELGFARLGGAAVHLDHRGEAIGQRETIEDYGRNLERWADLVVARVHRHDTLERLAAACRVPVINALSDRFHPCQALADFLTLSERGIPIPEARLAFVGAGNNVCHSLMETAALLGAEFVAVTPPDCRPDAAIEQECRELAAERGGRVRWSGELEAIRGVHAVYTDAWISMGERDDAARRAALEAYRIDERAMSIAGPRAIFMHCLPAHRGEEVCSAVIDGPRSAVFDQAENRLHAQNALMLRLLGAA